MVEETADEGESPVLRLYSLGRGVESGSVAENDVIGGLEISLRLIRARSSAGAALLFVKTVLKQYNGQLPDGMQSLVQQVIEEAKKMEGEGLDSLGVVHLGDASSRFLSSVQPRDGVRKSFWLALAGKLKSRLGTLGYWQGQNGRSRKGKERRSREVVSALQ